MDNKMATEILKELTDTQLLNVLGLREGDEFNLVNKRSNRINYNSYYVKNGEIKWKAFPSNTIKQITIVHLECILIGDLTIQKLKWVPEKNEGFYMADGIMNNGVCWCHNTLHDGILKSDILDERGIEYFKTKQEAKDKVKKLGWKVY